VLQRIAGRRMKYFGHVERMINYIFCFMDVSHIFCFMDVFMG